VRRVREARAALPGGGRRAEGAAALRCVVAALSEMSISVCLETSAKSSMKLQIA
jgi:hypothetical protein